MSREIDEKKQKIFDFLLQLHYSVEFPQEPGYSTAEYLNGREERARKYYMYNPIFSAKVKNSIGYILNIIGEKCQLK